MKDVMLFFATKKGFALQSSTKNILFLALCRMIQPTFHLPLLFPKVVASAGSYRRDLAAYKIKGAFSWKILTSLPTKNIFHYIYQGTDVKIKNNLGGWGGGYVHYLKLMLLTNIAMP